MSLRDSKLNFTFSDEFAISKDYDVLRSMEQAVMYSLNHHTL